MDPDPDTTPRDGSAISDHHVDSIDALAEFHLAHYRGATALQKAIDRLTGLVGTPEVLIVLAAGVAIWMGVIVGRGSPQTLFDWLELTGTCGALLVSVLILVTQRREDVLAERRSRLILELAIVADRKSAKIIALLEELRRDHPNVSDRVDSESNDMATPTDVLEVAAAIDERSADT